MPLTGPISVFLVTFCQSRWEILLSTGIDQAGVSLGLPPSRPPQGGSLAEKLRTAKAAGLAPVIEPPEGRISGILEVPTCGNK